MTTVTISHLTKRFDVGVVAVDDADLEIADGELVSLLGPSGCGKTTTLRCIAGFEEPSSGRILFDGRDIVALPPERRNIGMVFQNYALFPHMTVFQNLAFGLEMRRVPREAMGERIGRVLEIVQLAGREDGYPRQLSGGQQQRVALGRALVIEPSILLLDEPLANLDAKLRDDMRFFIRSLQKRVGITTVYVTHDQSEAMVLSDRVVVMFEGRIHQVGTPWEIYSEPVSREVASFIGLSNFIEGRLGGRDGNGRCTVRSSVGEIRCRARDDLPADREAVVLVRPEIVTIRREPPEGDAMNALSGRIAERFFLGNTATYRVSLADERLMTVQEDPWAPFEVGESVWCAFPGDQAWVIRA